MKKIIEEVIANESNKKTKKSGKNVKNNVLNDSLTKNSVNRELQEVLAGLTTTIKVVGCGGAGTNTIARCVASEITGAELIAMNTDAQHLLLTDAP
ncbi:MAG: cell division protein FtsZ, partial [Candidatus Thermoplasmatota archaeon]|nr:cell division protein FtsZ [Candidatus Thermoplasmatota archaeon]